MNYNFYNNTIKKQTVAFTPSTSNPGKQFSVNSFRYDPKQSLPVSRSQVGFDRRTSPFFNSVSEAEIEELTVEFDALSLEKDLNEIEKTVRKQKFQENADWAKNKRGQIKVKNPDTLNSLLSKIENNLNKQEQLLTKK